MSYINIGKVTEELNELAGDKVAKGHEVIEFQAPTAGNDYTWYRKYADGWVEQGGIYKRNATGTFYLTLPVTMLNTNYTAIMSCAVKDRTTDFTSNWTFAPYSTTQCQIYSAGTVYSDYGWLVYGMYAQ